MWLVEAENGRDRTYIGDEATQADIDALRPKLEALWESPVARVRQFPGRDQERIADEIHGTRSARRRRVWQRVWHDWFVKGA